MTDLYEDPGVNLDRTDALQADLIAAYPSQLKNLERMFGRIRGYAPARQKAVLGALERYVQEAKKNSYRAETSSLVDLIAENSLQDTSVSVELGAGAGDLLKRLALARTDQRFVGVDLSPGFVSNFQIGSERPLNAEMNTGLIDDPEDLEALLVELGIDLKESAVSSVLTLDRVSQPAALLNVMGRFKRSVLGVLLPTSPFDDNPSIPEAERRVYTLPEDRLTPGRTRDEDRALLQRYLEQAWGGNVRQTAVPYTVWSSGDEQPYELDVYSR